eukprot:2534513-Pleurochrysis_carterae.AAC.1
MATRYEALAFSLSMCACNALSAKEPNVHSRRPYYRTVHEPLAPSAWVAERKLRQVRTLLNLGHRKATL